MESVETSESGGPEVIRSRTQQTPAITKTQVLEDVGSPTSPTATPKEKTGRRVSLLGVATAASPGSKRKRASVEKSGRRKSELVIPHGKGLEGIEARSVPKAGNFAASCAASFTSSIYSRFCSRPSSRPAERSLHSRSCFMSELQTSGFLKNYGQTISSCARFTSATSSKTSVTQPGTNSFEVYLRSLYAEARKFLQILKKERLRELGGEVLIAQHLLQSNAEVLPYI